MSLLWSLCRNVGFGSSGWPLGRRRRKSAFQRDCAEEGGSATTRATECCFSPEYR